jgi:cystathionine beta-lyase/cystathionine gamma-synthase
MSGVGPWLDPRTCPLERPPLDAMHQVTRDLHDRLDAHARREGSPYLHPDEPTVQLDLFGSARVIAWQEGKAASMFLAEECWSALPPLYARYGTAATGELLARLRALEHARAALACDSGMQATALVFDVLMSRDRHAVLMRQVYNKTRAYLEWLAARVGGSVTIVDDGDWDAIDAAIGPQTAFVFAETFTNPLVRAQDITRLVATIAAARGRAPGLRLMIDSTIATPWAFRSPLLDQGVDVVLGSGTKALGGTDRDLWGYIATNDVALGNSVMDLLAMRGGILDWRRAQAVVRSWDQPAESAERRDSRTERRDFSPVDAHARRCATATRVAAFLASHPLVSEVFHPSLPSHPDAAVIRDQYVRHGSLLSFRVAGADEARTRHVADVLATTIVVRYALSFDGLATKVNHHQTVSEYFTAPAQLKRNGFDRLIRLGIGLEDPDDLIAALNWTLHHADTISPDDLAAWQRRRMAELGVQ